MGEAIVVFPQKSEPYTGNTGFKVIVNSEEEKCFFNGTIIDFRINSHYLYANELNFAFGECCMISLAGQLKTKSI